MSYLNVQNGGYGGYIGAGKGGVIKNGNDNSGGVGGKSNIHNSTNNHHSNINNNNQ